MNELFERIVRDKFVRVFGANGILTIAKSFITVLSSKIVATVIGASGIAMVGQLQNFIAIATLVSNGGFSQGLTKYIAEYKTNEENTIEFINTAFFITLIITSIVSVIILSLSKTISIQIFTDIIYFPIIIVFSATLIFYNLNNLIIAIVNGLQLYKQYFVINTSTTIIGVVITIALVIQLKVFGAMLAIVLSQSIVFVMVFFIVRHSYWLKKIRLCHFSKEKMFRLLKYTMITILASLIWPIVRITIRTYIINNVSAEQAGLWQATVNINDYIVSFAVGSFSIYLLPQLSSINDKDLLIKELKHIFRIIIPIILAGYSVVYIYRDYVLIILYSSEFLKASKYILLEMVGSFFWMCKIPLMNFLLAKGLTVTYMLNEIIFALVYIGLSIILIPIYLVQGIQISFAIYNFIYLLVNIVVVYRYFN